MFCQQLLVVMRRVLRATIREVNTAFGWLAWGDGHVERSDCQIPFHTITDSPPNDTARIEIKDNC